MLKIYIMMGLATLKSIMGKFQQGLTGNVKRVEASSGFRTKFFSI